MSILYDATATQPSSGSEYHGGGEYAHTVLKSIIQDHAAKIDLLINEEKEIKREINEIIRDKNITTYDVKKYTLKEIFSNYERFYTSMPYKYTDDSFEGITSIVTLHGLRSIEVFKDKYEHRFIESTQDLLDTAKKTIMSKRAFKEKYDELKKIIRSHDSIIVPSLHTKYSILSNFMSAGEMDLKVLYSPLQVNQEPKSNDLKMGTNNGFILMVSCDRWVKNSVRAVMALDELFSSKPTYPEKVILTGLDSLYRFPKLKNPERFDCQGYVPRKQLECFFKNASFLLYPTLNEGFGYPPYEAMKYGTPVACSGVGALTEIYGQAPVYFDPRSKMEIMNRCHMLLRDSYIYNKKCSLSCKKASEIGERMKKDNEKICKEILGSG